MKTSAPPTRFAAVRSAAFRFWESFSFVGLVVATAFFAASLSPSLLPRPPLVQGLLSGFAAAIGYGIGVLLVWLWAFAEIPQPGERWLRLGRWAAVIGTAILTVVFLWRATVWQNSIRELMGLEPMASAYPLTVAPITLVTSLVLLVAARGVGLAWSSLHRRLTRVVPARVSYLLTTVVVALLIFLLVNDVVAAFALRTADSVFLALDGQVDDGIAIPEDDLASGSEASLVAWETIGRQGKRFIADGPTRDQIETFTGNKARQPLRVYVGLASRPTMKERAELALEELKRVGGFERSVLIVATPTGTGWLDPAGVDTVEYLHGGDTAIVSMQYSYLPSWITILVDPRRSIESGTYLFAEIYRHWKSLPAETRPKLYVHGLSLGALGSSASADLFTIFEDPIQGGLWSGPPFPSVEWGRATKYRNPESPMWLPEFRDGSMLRFTGRTDSVNEPPRRWGPMRFVYLQHASDPMTFFSPDLLWQEPDWLRGERGPDVSPYLRWLPVVTFLQIAFDLPLATSVPLGYGHNYSPDGYIHGWVAVTDPPEWTESETERLIELFDAE